MQHNVLSIDQGTTSTRSIVFNSEGNVIAAAQKELTQQFPKPGWVEHNPIEIITAVKETAASAVGQLASGWKNIDTIGIANQRETTLIWDRKTGTPLGNAIVWQDTRTNDFCSDLLGQGHHSSIKLSTGLKLNPYFSATKIRWLLDSITDGQKRAENGELCFGTIDSWIVFNLTEGKKHLTDSTNASRTMLLNIHNLNWDPEMLSLFNIPSEILPNVLPSASNFGLASPNFFGSEISISGIAGDQHSSLYGQLCFKKGMTKCTYGTGAFILTNEGNSPPSPNNRTDDDLLSTLGFQVGTRTCYASEGSIFASGSTIQWLRDGLGIIKNASDTNNVSTLAKDNGGVYFVPAFSGLGSPHWNPEAKSIIVGMTRGTARSHIIRAALESTAYQVKDVIDKSLSFASSDFPLRVDGGQTTNPFLMQFQADIIDRPVEISKTTETTALGAALIAGKHVGIWQTEKQIESINKPIVRYEPQMKKSQRISLYSGWKDAVKRCCMPSY